MWQLIYRSKRPWQEYQSNSSDYSHVGTVSPGENSNILGVECVFLGDQTVNLGRC